MSGQRISLRNAACQASSRKEDWYRDFLSFAILSFRLASSGVRPEPKIHTHVRCA